MEFEPILDPKGPILIHRQVHRDSRGAFVECYHAPRYHEAGITETFVQANCSRSRAKVLRGLHFQRPHAQGKLVSVTRGEVFDVAVDIRLGSPTFARVVTVRLSAENGKQLYIPPDFAHGFLTLSVEADVTYHCTDLYHPDGEHTLRWDDPRLVIDWPVGQPIVSEKDEAGLTLDELERAGRLPTLQGSRPECGREEQIAVSGAVPVRAG
jgi:dTDP-4-dehydrorhamnose 3,5-epimerase